MLKQAVNEKGLNMNALHDRRRETDGRFES